MGLFDTTTGRRVAKHVVDDPANTSLSFDPSSSRLIATFGQKPPVILEVPSLRVLQQPTFAEGRIIGARWSEDGRWLLTVDEQRRVSVRHPETFELVSVLDGSQMAQNVAFLPIFSVGGGQRILSVVNDAPALWDARTGTPIGAPFPMSGGMSTGGFDGLDLAVSALDEHVLLWDLDVDGWYAIACRAAGRNLTAEEWARFGPRDQAYRPTCAEWPAGL